MADTQRFQPASRDLIPPLASEPGELIEKHIKLSQGIDKTQESNRRPSSTMKSFTKL